MTDIANRPRRFCVWLDYTRAGFSTEEEFVDVPAGEDADELCKEALDSLIDNFIDTGWAEESE